MEIKPEIKSINDWLLKYGGQSPNGLPMFRLAWSNDQFEFRKGTFNIYSGDLFLRTDIGTKLVRKYNYIHERWILERWAPQELVKSDETPLVTNGDYIPVWVYEDKFHNYLEPTQKVIEFQFYMMQKGKASTEQDIMNEILIKEDQEIQTFMDMIDTSPIGNALHMREAVGYSKGSKDLQ